MTNKTCQSDIFERSGKVHVIDIIENNWLNSNNLFVGDININIFLKFRISNFILII